MIDNEEWFVLTIPKAKYEAFKSLCETKKKVKGEVAASV